MSKGQKSWSIATILTVVGIIVGAGTWYISSIKADSKDVGSTGARVTNLEQTVGRIDSTVEDIRREQMRQGQDLAAIKASVQKRE